MRWRRTLKARWASDRQIPGLFSIVVRVVPYPDAMKIAVWLFTLVLLACAGCSIDAGTDGDSSKDDKPSREQIVTCDDLAEDAVRISSEQAQSVQLLKVREPQVKKDNQPIDELPAHGEVLALSCTGTGVWSDGDSSTRVLLRYTIDSDGDGFVYYGPIE